MTDLITEARELLSQAKTYIDATDGRRLDHLLKDGYDARYAELVCFSVAHLSELCDALEKANSKLDYLHEDIGSVRAQLHTATFSTNKGAADMAKFILALLPAPPEKEGE